MHVLVPCAVSIKSTKQELVSKSVSDKARQQSDSCPMQLRNTKTQAKMQLQILRDVIEEWWYAGAMGELGGASDTRYDDRDKQMFKIAPTIITVAIIIINLQRNHFAKKSDENVIDKKSTWPALTVLFTALWDHVIHFDSSFCSNVPALAKKQMSHKICDLEELQTNDIDCPIWKEVQSNGQDLPSCLQ